MEWTGPRTGHVEEPMFSEDLNQTAECSRDMFWEWRRDEEGCHRGWVGFGTEWTGRRSRRRATSGS